MRTVSITYVGESGKLVADLIQERLSSSGIEDVEASRNSRELGGALGVGEVMVTLVVASAFKAALGMAFDALEEALRDAAHDKDIRLKIQLEREGTEEARTIPIITSHGVDKAISLAVKTAKEVVEAWLL